MTIELVSEGSDDGWGSACENCTDLSKRAETLLNELARVYDL